MPGTSETGFTILNPGCGGSVMDEEKITFQLTEQEILEEIPAVRHRPKIIISGVNADDISSVLNNSPIGNEYALVVRNIPSGVQQISGSVNAAVELPGPPVTLFGITTLVPSSVETTVASFIVPVGYTFHAVGFIASGSVNAIFQFYLDTAVKSAARNSVAEPTVSIDFNYAYPSLGAGLIAKVTATHYQTGINADFEATILGYLT